MIALRFKGRNNYLGSVMACPGLVLVIWFSYRIDKNIIPITYIGLEKHKKDSGNFLLPRYYI